MGNFGHFPEATEVVLPTEQASAPISAFTELTVLSFSV